jgi:hypothetical protein
MTETTLPPREDIPHLIEEALHPPSPTPTEASTVCPTNTLEAIISLYKAHLATHPISNTDAHAGPLRPHIFCCTAPYIASPPPPLRTEPYTPKSTYEQLSNPSRPLPRFLRWAMEGEISAAALWAGFVGEKDRDMGVLGLRPLSGAAVEFYSVGWAGEKVSEARSGEGEGERGQSEEKVWRLHVERASPNGRILADWCLKSGPGGEGFARTHFEERMLTEFSLIAVLWCPVHCRAYLVWAWDGMVRIRPRRKSVYVEKGGEEAHWEFDDVQERFGYQKDHEGGEGWKGKPAKDEEVQEVKDADDNFSDADWEIVDGDGPVEVDWRHGQRSIPEKVAQVVMDAVTPSESWQGISRSLGLYYYWE